MECANGKHSNKASKQTYQHNFILMVICHVKKGWFMLSLHYAKKVTHEVDKRAKQTTTSNIMFQNTLMYWNSIINSDYIKVKVIKKWFCDCIMAYIYRPINIQNEEKLSLQNKNGVTLPKSVESSIIKQALNTTLLII